MSDEQTLSVYDARVEDYAKLIRRDEIDPDLLRFMKQVKAGGLVLDLGCGPAMASAILREHGFRPDPVDASGEMVRLANETHDIGARVATFDDIGSEAGYEAVWANFSLLHAKKRDLPVHLAAIYKTLKPGGIFHIGMKTGEGERRDRIGRFYAYYSEEELTGMLEDAGFTVLDTTVGEDSIGLSGEVSPWVTILAKR